MSVIYDEKICVKCAACVTESECGGITIKDGKICIESTCAEDWANIAAICPTGALQIKYPTKWKCAN